MVALNKSYTPSAVLPGTLAIPILPNFSNFKPKYSALFINTQADEIEITASLPDKGMRNEDSKRYRVILAQKNEICLSNYDSLKRYIIDAFPKAEHKLSFASAGQSYCKKAKRNNWDSVNAMNDAASAFVTKHLATLTANQVMPPAFQTTLNAAIADFKAQHSLFIAEEAAIAAIAQAKVEANNKLCRNLKAMLADGQTIFKKNPAVKKQFTFSFLRYLASGIGTSGIKGSIVDALTDQPLSGVEISIVKKNRTITSDDTGHYELLQVASGRYKIKFTKAGYLPVILEDYEIKRGITSTLNQFMTPIPQDDNES